MITLPWVTLGALILVVAAGPARAADEAECPPRPCAGRSCPALPPELAGLDCEAPAELTVEIENRSDSAVGAMVEGELADPSATCASVGAITYPETPAPCDPGATCLLVFSALRPGTWVHRLHAQAAGSDPQNQGRRSVLAAASSSAPVNRVHWVVYPRTFVTPPKAAELRHRLESATAYLAGTPGAAALVTFDWSHSLYPGPCDPPIRIAFGNTERCPDPVTCSATRGCASGDAKPADAGFCWTATGLVFDALDPRGEPGRVVVSGRDVPSAPLLRILGNDNVLRGLALSGNPAPGTQVDTITFDGTASGNRLEDMIIDGPGEGDAVSAQCDSHDNVLVRSDIRGAEDKGVKVADRATLLVTDSCVARNRNGGVQATCGGDVTALRNLVQLNFPGGAENGIWARGWPGLPTSDVTTDANIVRFNGAKGLAATDSARAAFRNDYVANNQYAGARIESTAPCSADGPVARFDGVAFVCNAARAEDGGPLLTGSCVPDEHPVPCSMAAPICDAGKTCRGDPPKGLGLGVEYGNGEFGACTTTGAACDCDDSRACVGTCRPPAVSLGAGRNAFVAQPLAPGEKAGQVYAEAGVVPVDARGNFWDQDDCGASGCTPAHVIGAVEAVPALEPVPGGPLTIDAVWPVRPARGEVVRVWGSGFDALAGNAVDRDAAGGATDCSTTPPPDDPCDPANDAVSRSNRVGGANAVALEMFGVRFAADVVAVTPAMLAFRMPVDCFAANARLVVERTGGASADWPLCTAPPDCLGAPDDSPCEPDGMPCTKDVCRAEGCIHELVPAGTVSCRPATDPCDAAEYCSGDDAACPPDERIPHCPAVTTTTASSTTTTTTGTTGTTAPPTGTTAPPATPTTSSLPARDSSTTTASSTTITTTSSTTTTTRPCAALGATFDRVLDSGACDDSRVGKRFRKNLRARTDVVSRACSGVPESGASLERHACKVIARKSKLVQNASRRPRPKLTRQCAAPLRAAISNASSALGCRPRRPSG